MASVLSVLLLLLALSSSPSFLSSPSEIIRKGLRTKGINQEMVTKLSRPVHPNLVDPSRVVQLSWRPRLFLYQGFLSDEECDQLISLARERSSREGDDSGVATMDVKLESSGTHALVEDDIVSRIEERISAWTFLPKYEGKGLKVLHYGKEDPKENLTYFGDRLSVEEQKDESQPLIATVILYLSNVNRGGHILFPSSEEKNNMWSDCANNSDILRPTKGNALLFFNRHHNATPDPSSTHTRCSVEEGEMWCAAKFFRVKVQGQEKLSSDDYLCSDQDKNCAKWAAMGECQRNPIFMVGSDDYLGTCRLSCNVC